jgi:SAM-dependent methyltransferase
VFRYLKMKLTTSLDKLADQTADRVVERLPKEKLAEQIRSTLTSGGFARQIGEELLRGNLAGHIVEQSSDHLLTDRIQQRLADLDLVTHVADRLATSPSFSSKIAFTVALEALLHFSTERTPHGVFRNVNDDFWCWVLTEAALERPALADLVPVLPPKELQEHYTGFSGLPTLLEAFEFYSTLKQLHRQYARQKLEDCSAILDYGCGWGRVIRFFLKEIEPARLFGADPIEDVIELCKRTNPWCQFQLIDTEPPTPFADETFDFIYAFSVFSHLSEDYHKRILRELHRILRPGGLLMVTTHGREYITQCAEARLTVDPASLPPSVAASLQSFRDPDKALDDYDQGRYCFGSLAHLVGWEYWGDTAISKAYASTQWGPLFKFVDYVDDRKRCSQNIIVARKEPAAA